MKEKNSIKEKAKPYTVLFIPSLLISVMLIFFGIYLIVNNLVMTGRNWRTLQPTAKGGELYILFGVVFLVVAYFNLSPFNRLRQYVEGKSKRDKGKSDQVQTK